MKLVRTGVWVAMLTLIAMDLFAAQPFAQWHLGTAPPLHPTIIDGTYKGKELPIINVSGDTPQVEVDGKRKSLLSGSKTRYTPIRGAIYAPGSISLKSLSANSQRTNITLMFSNGSQVSGGTFSESSDFSATVVPTQDYPDCFVALVFFEQDYLEGNTDNPGASVQFSSIKPLVGGKENKIKVTFGYMDFGNRRMGFFPLFFTRGLEIRSDRCELVAQFFRHREDIIHQAMLKSYFEKNAGASHPLQPYLQIPPIFPDGTHVEDLPHSIKASFMVTDEGRVESIQMDDRLPANVFSLLRRTLNGWLFLPRLKEGRAVRTMVTVPIVLRPDAESPEKPAGS